LRSNDALQKYIIRLVKMGKVETVSQLVESVGKRYRIGEDEVIQAVKALNEEGKIVLEPPPIPADNILGYLKRVENLWFPLSLLVILITVLTIYLVPEESIIKPVRWIFGSIFVLYLPGYLTVEALFPDPTELDNIERIALSIGLSLAITPLIGLILNYTPWGIRLNPVVASLSIYSFILCLAAVYRKFKANLNRFLTEVKKLE